uniref:Transmembrane protein n=1 Tax=Medicago truncatula TaxID=3880 RepID=I3SPE0_MEDTR|nr:unknown [Medicago truncatula]
MHKSTLSDRVMLPGGRDVPVFSTWLLMCVQIQLRRQKSKYYFHLLRTHNLVMENHNHH